MEKYVSLEELEKLIKNKMNEFNELRKNPGFLPKDAYTAMMVGVDEIREDIRNLPIMDIDILQRYKEMEYPGIDGYYIEEDNNGEYVRYDSLVELLNN